MPVHQPFPIIDASGWDVVVEETSGATPKIWLAQPDTTPEVFWLFKAATVSGHVHGEDWAEKAASHLGRLLGIPCAEVDLATWQSYAGCISRNLRPDNCEMQPGRAQMEKRAAPRYVHHSKGKDHPGHSLENIRMVLSDVAPPPDCQIPFDGSAFDVFAGYVLFDAWIANQDRHDHNWSVLIPGTATPGPTRLCGSYDHGSALGFGVRPAACEAMVTSKVGVETWCSRGRALRFEGRPHLADAARGALDLASPAARAYWPAQLEAVDLDAARRVLGRISRMSDGQRSFAMKVLEVNRRRLLDACA